MKKYLVLPLCLLMTVAAMAKQPSHSEKLDSALKKELAKACNSSECYIQALEEKNYPLVENTLAKYIDTNDRNNYIYAKVKVGNREVTTLEYLIHLGDLGEAHKLFVQYFNPVIFEGEDFPNRLLEKLAFQKNNPDRDSFARAILSSKLMPNIYSRTLNYAVTQADDEKGYKYVELLISKRVDPISPSKNTSLNTKGIPNPMILPSELRTAVDVVENEIEFARRQGLDTTWLNKTKALVQKKSL